MKSLIDHSDEENYGIRLSEGQELARHMANRFFELPSEEFRNFFNRMKSQYPDMVKGEYYPGFFGIVGAAGTGKTTVAGMLNVAPECHAAAALSHKAKSVLRSKLDCECFTMASTFALSPYKDSAGRDKYKENPMAKSIPFRNYDSWIFDEASQLGPEWKERALKVPMDSMPKRILFLGDKYQLGPISDEDDPFGKIVSPFLEMGRIELNEVLRYGDGILSFVERIKRLQEKGGGNAQSIFSEGLPENVERISDKREFIENAIAHIKRDDSLDNFVIVSYKRDTTREYDFEICKGLGLMPFTKGCRFLFKDNGYTSPDSQNSTWENGETDIILGHEDMAIEGCTDKYGRKKSMEIRKLRLAKSPSSSVYILREESAYNRMLAYYAEMAQCRKNYDKEGFTQKMKEYQEEFPDWRKLSELFGLNDGYAIKGYNVWADYYKIKNFFAAPNMGYAITSHVSQGSTYKKVAVDMHDIMGIKVIGDMPKLRSLYTACTRPSETLYVYG